MASPGVSSDTLLFSSVVSATLLSLLLPSVDSPLFLGAGFLLGLRKLCAWASSSARCLACCALNAAEAADVLVAAAAAAALAELVLLVVVVVAAVRLV